MQSVTASFRYRLVMMSANVVASMVMSGYAGAVTPTAATVANYVLTNLGDRMEMAHSIEGRVPFMDHHVAEYLRTIPVALKIRGMTEKYILREAMKGTTSRTRSPANTLRTRMGSQ